MICKNQVRYALYGECICLYGLSVLVYTCVHEHGSSCFKVCKADFCWVCLGPWEPHGSSWYNCNRYDEAEARAARTNQVSGAFLHKLKIEN